MGATLLRGVPAQPEVHFETVCHRLDNRFAACGRGRVAEAPAKVLTHSSSTRSRPGQDPLRTPSGSTPEPLPWVLLRDVNSE